MINEDTLDIEAAVNGIVQLAEAGSEIIRVTTPSMAHAGRWVTSALRYGRGAATFLWWRMCTTTA